MVILNRGVLDMFVNIGENLRCVGIVFKPYWFVLRLKLGGLYVASVLVRAFRLESFVLRIRRFRTLCF